jgi:hypothetical protein
MLIAESWRREQCRIANHAGIVVQAPCRDASSGAKLGDIVHGFHPQLAYPFKLSFLKHDVFGDERFAPMTRSQRN